LKRQQPTKDEKLATALLQLLHFIDGKWQPIIDRESAKKLTAKEICGLLELDHYPISVFMGGSNHPTNMQWLTPEEHLKKTQSLDRETHNKVRRNKKKRMASLTAADVKRVDTYLERNKVHKPGDITWVDDPKALPYDVAHASCGCVFADLNTTCQDPDCRICFKVKAKEELTARQKAYRKAVYEQRKAKRKKPHGWSKKKK